MAQSTAAVRAWLIAAALLACTSIGCEQKRLEVLPAGSSDPDGREALIAAVARFSQSDRSPANYNTLALEIERLRPQFNGKVVEEAERNVVVLALEPLEAVYEQPPSAQRDALALTVWPTALGVQPKDDEGPDAYTERLCREQLAFDCNRIVPEYRPIVLSALVWNRLKERVRLALGTCEVCKDDPTYSQVLLRFEKREAEMTTRAAEISRLAHPKRWPTAGPHATPWSQPGVTVIYAKGVATLDGRRLDPENWGDVNADKAGTEVLGVMVEPGTTVSKLRSLGKSATAAGFRQLAVQTRAPQYPYALREYRVRLSDSELDRPEPITVGDEDPIQLLVDKLDAAILAGAALPSI